MKKWSHTLWLIRKYLHYWVSAQSGKGHGIHSPFVFEFITRILNDKTRYPAYEKVENLRKALLKDTQTLRVDDLGAGSRTDSGPSRTVASIASRAAKPPKYAQLLYRMVRQYQPGQILELGTSLGLTSAYLAEAAPHGQLVTLEGAEEVADRAARNLEQLGLSNVRIVRGNFDQTLPAILAQSGPVDFVFLDGNHRKEPTLRYFEQLKPHLHQGSVLVFDDIHWTTEMEEAWTLIQQDPRVQCSIDLFFIGIVFFRDAFREKQDFTIRF